MTIGAGAIRRRRSSQISEDRNMEKIDTLRFFDQKPYAYSLYQRFRDRVLAEIGEASIKVQKTQITFSNRRVFACVSQMRVRKKTGTPGGIHCGNLWIESSGGCCADCGKNRTLPQPLDASCIGIQSGGHRCRTDELGAGSICIFRTKMTIE